MRCTAHTRRVWCALAILGGGLFTPVLAQEGAFSNRSAELSEVWRSALEGVLARDAAAAEPAFQALLEQEISPLRLALLAEDVARRGQLGGGLLLFEQDARAGKLEAAGAQIAERLETGREQLAQADDGFYFAAIGRFDVSAANFQALLESKPDAAAVLEFVEDKPRRRLILSQIVGNPIVGPQAREMLRLLEMGEVAVKADPKRIRANIGRLAGPPRGFDIGLANLRESGEYAVPFIIEELQKPGNTAMLRPLLRVLPQLDRSAVIPLCIALEMSDHTTKRYLIDALGQIGYQQAIPYLLKLRDAEGTPGEVKAAVEQALAQIRARARVSTVDANAAAAFFDLAEEFYNNSSTVAADPRLDQANIWYWNDGYLQNIKAPTAIYDEIMAMRAAEETLLLNPDHKGAIALWIGSNFRRADQLGAEQVDETRPESDPPPAYYAQSAGAEYCLMALNRALQNGEGAVALGCIAALRNIGGPVALAADGPGALPLAEALTFPDPLVRIRAGLALAQAVPSKSFPNYQNLIPVLSEALLLSGAKRYAVVVNADDAVANSQAALLRGAGFEVISDANLSAALSKARAQTPTTDLIVLPSDLSGGAAAGIGQIRRDFRFANTPVLLAVREGTESEAERIIAAAERAGRFPETEDAAILEETLTQARGADSTVIDAEQAGALALEAARVIERLGDANTSVFELAQAEAALTAALQSDEGELRIAAANALAFVPTQTAQEALLKAAADAELAEEVRVALFDALAKAGRRVGQKLTGEPVDQLVTIVSSESNLTVREAASRALGALNVSGNPASQIIRNQHRG